jgi:hypothetical protein
MEKTEVSETTGEQIMKDGVEISMPPLDKAARLNMERCAEFLARMIQKYGGEVLDEIGSEQNVDKD